VPYRFGILKIDLKFPRIKTLHQLVHNLESKSPVVEAMKARECPDSELAAELQVFANEDHEKDLVLDGLEYLVNQGFFDDAKKKLLEVLNEDSFYRGFPELAAYGWLERHSLAVKPQVEVNPPGVLNPNGCILDGVLSLYNPVPASR